MPYKFLIRLGKQSKAPNLDEEKGVGDEAARESSLRHIGARHHRIRHWPCRSRATRDPPLHPQKPSQLNSITTRRGRRGRARGIGYVLDGLEGEGGVPEEDAGGPGTLGVGTAPAGGRWVREAGEGGAGIGDRGEGEEGESCGKVGGRGGRWRLAAAMLHRRPRG